MAPAYEPIMQYSKSYWHSLEIAAVPALELDKLVEIAAR